MISRGSKVPRVAKSQRAEGRGDAEPAEQWSQRGRRELIPPLDRGCTPVHERPMAVLAKLGRQNANPRGGEPKARATR